MSAQFSSLSLTDSAHARVDLANVNFSADRRQMTLGVQPSLPPGAYTVSWRAMSALDGHITNGAYAISAKTTSLGGNGLTCQGVPCGHYLRQFGPVGAETLGFYQTRDTANRGDVYPPPLWLADPRNFTKGMFDSWDCKNTGAPGDGSTAAVNPEAGPGPGGGKPTCWVAPPLPGARPGTITRVTAARYSSR